MNDYPVMLRLEERRCVVVGAGPVGLRKARGLVEAGADVLLVADRLDRLACPGGIEVRNRRFRDGDLDGAFLVFAATGDPGINRSIAAAARSRSIPVCVVDAPAAGDFTVPAGFRSGDISVAVATGGRSPALASILRDVLEQSLSPAWKTFLAIASVLRSRELTNPGPTAYNQQVLRNLFIAGILDKIEASDRAGVDRLLEMEIGVGCSLADLGISLPERSP